MTKDEIAKYAFNGQTPPELLNLADRCLYYHMAYIAAMYKSKFITPAQATAMKTDAYVDYTADIVAYQHGKDAMLRLADIYKQMELAASAYRKNRTEDPALKVIECAEKILDAVYGDTMKKGA